MKLFVFDIDGTLIDDTFDENGEYIVYPEVITALNEILLKGDAVLFASGRSYTGILQFINLFSFSPNVYASTSNGACLYSRGGDLLVHHYLPFSVFETMFNAYGRHPDWTYMCYLSDGRLGYVEPKNFAPEEAKFNKMPLVNLEEISLPSDYKIEKASFTCGSDSAYDVKVVPELQKYDSYATSSFFFEFVAKGVSKSASVSELAHILNIDKDDIYTFGDGKNDIEMVRDFHGTAMGDAQDEVKVVAEYITDTAQNRGIVKALREKWGFID